MDIGSSATRVMKVLVVEDEYLIATSLCDELQRRDMRPVGPFACVARTLDAIEGGEDIDAGILNIDIGGQAVFPIAERLAAAHVPFVFATGYDEWSIPEAFSAVRRFDKPFEPEAIIASIAGWHGRLGSMARPERSAAKCW